MILSFFIKFLLISIYYGATRMWGVESTPLERTESKGVDYKNRFCEWSVHWGCSESAWMVTFLIFLGLRAIRLVCCRNGYNEPTSHPAGNGLIGPTIFSDGPDFLNNFSETKSIF